MTGTDPEGDAPQTRAFLSLPAELRNKIYDSCFATRPRAGKILHGYIDVPSDALLRTCNKINDEATLLYHSGLKHALLQRKVLIHLRSIDTDGKVRHAGWTKVNRGRFDIWVRRDAEPQDEIDWLVWPTFLWFGGCGNKLELEAVREKEAEVLELLELVEGWMERFASEGKSSAIMRRLYCIHSRVSETVWKLRAGTGVASGMHQASTFSSQSAYRSEYGVGDKHG